MIAYASAECDAVIQGSVTASITNSHRGSSVYPKTLRVGGRSLPINQHFRFSLANIFTSRKSRKFFD